jgi:hypothetical protein
VSGAVVSGIVSATATHFVLASPTGTIPVGSPIEFVIEAVDSDGNVDTTFNDYVSFMTTANALYFGAPTGVAYNGGTVPCLEGVADLGQITFKRAGYYTVSISTVSGLSTVITDAFTVVPVPGNLGFTTPPPTITGERIVRLGKLKPFGLSGFPSDLEGIELEFSEPLTGPSARNAANYTLTQTFMRKRKTVTQRVSFVPLYIYPLKSVVLVLKGKPKFATGGELIVNVQPPTGLVGESGEYGNDTNYDTPGDDAVFIISPKARRITQ